MIFHIDVNGNDNVHEATDKVLVALLLQRLEEIEATDYWHEQDKRDSKKLIKAIHRLLKYYGAYDNEFQRATTA